MTADLCDVGVVVRPGGGDGGRGALHVPVHPLLPFARLLLLQLGEDRRLALREGRHLLEHGRLQGEQERGAVGRWGWGAWGHVTYPGVSRGPKLLGEAISAHKNASRR